MDEEKTAVAKRCLDGSYGNTMSFPECVKTLATTGFEGYLVDYRQNSRIYYLPDGETLSLKNPHDVGTIEAEFDQAAVAEAIKWAQGNSPDYSYMEFNRKVTSYGCAGYMVSFIGRRVVYFGRTAETHIEHFPAKMSLQS